MPDIDPDTEPVPPPPARAVAGGCLGVAAWCGLVTGALVFGWTVVRWAPAAAGTSSMGDQFELAAIELVAWAGLVLAGTCGLVLVLLPAPSRAASVVAAVVGVLGLITLVWGVTGAATRRDSAVRVQLGSTYWELLSYAGLGATVLAAILAGRVLWARRR